MFAGVFLCWTNTMVKLMQNIFSTFCAPCTLSTVFKKAINVVTSYKEVEDMTRLDSSFSLWFWESRNRNMRALAYREESHGSLILKWFRSQVEQVKWLQGRQKWEKEEGKNRSFLKANGLSMVILYYIEYYKTCWLHVTVLSLAVY